MVNHNKKKCSVQESLLNYLIVELLPFVTFSCHDYLKITVWIFTKVQESFYGYTHYKKYSVPAQ